MDPSLTPKVVVRPASIRLDATRESKFVTDALAILKATRQSMGWSDNGIYTRDSWLWLRSRAEQRYRDNFTDRLAPGEKKLWKNCNRSLNLISVVVDQHLSRLSRDFHSSAFLALRADPEDQGYILKPAEQYLQKRAAKTRLGWKIRTEGLRGALIRGESVFKALPNRRTRTIQQKLRILMQPREDGQGLEPALDSKLGVIHERESWIPHSEDETLEVLQRDPRTQRRRGGIPTYSDQPRSIDVTVSEPAGSDIEYPFWADMVFDLDAPDLDRATIKAHLFEMRLDDLWDHLPKSLLTPAAETYYQQHSQPQGSDGLRMRSEQSYHDWKAGEMPDNQTQVSTPGISEPRLFAEIWIRYDLDGDRHREDLCLLVDVQAEWPISYGHAHEILGDTARRHPFGVERIFPEPKRAYGRGLYVKAHDLSEEIDADVCRLSIEKAKSGNILIENRNATEEGKAGIPLEFRTPRTFKRAKAGEEEKVLEVIAVTPIITDIQKSLSDNITTFMARFGGITPGDTQGQELAANTATGLQILQETKNEQVEQRNEELREGPIETDGLKGHLRLFAELELLNLSPLEVSQEFGNSRTPTGKKIPLIGEDGQPVLQPAPLPVEGSVDTPVRSPSPSTAQPPLNAGSASPQPPQTTAQLPQVPVMVDETVPTAETLLSWASTLTPARIRSMVELVVSRSRSTQIIQTNDNIMVILDKWKAYSAEEQQIIKPLFIDMLLALDVNNPIDYLDRLSDLGRLDPTLRDRALNGSSTNNPTPKPRDTPPPASSQAKRITGRPENVPQPQPTL